VEEAAVVAKALLAARTGSAVPSVVGMSAATSHLPVPWWFTQHWYTVTVFVAGVVVFVTVGAVRRLTMQRRLRWYLEASAPLTADTSRLQVEVEGAMPLKSPWMTSLVVENLSRSEIGKSDFDGGKPLVVDLGVPVVAVTSASQAWAAKACPDGRQLWIGPETIPGHGSATIGVLTDGEPHLSVAAPSLVNVTVSTEAFGGLPEQAAQRLRLRIREIALAVVLLACLALLAVVSPGWAVLPATVAVAGAITSLATERRYSR
jgi:hypothetical protein